MEWGSYFGMEGIEMAMINGVSVIKAKEAAVLDGNFAPRSGWVKWVIVVLLGLVGFGCWMVHEAERSADLREAQFNAAFEKELRRLEREAMEAGPLELYRGEDGQMHAVGTPQSIIDAAISKRRANGGPVAERSAWSDEMQRESVRELRRPYPVVPYP